MPSPLRRLYAWLLLARISNAPTVVSNALAGAALAGAAPSPEGAVRAAGALLCFYTGGMLLNDYCDRQTDARERPDRPIPAGLVSPGAVLLGVIVLFFGGLCLLALGGPAGFFAGVVLVGLIVWYDLYHKQTPWSSVIMGLCRAATYMAAGLTLAPAAPRLMLAAGGALLAIYVVAVTLAARAETGGRPARWPLALLLLPLPVVLIAARGGTLPVALAVGAAGWTLWSCRLLYREPPRVGPAVGRLLAGICLLDGLLIAARGGPTGWVVAALICWVAASALQRAVPGT